MKQVKIEIYGRVQGVNFRRNVKSFCDEVGLFGIVMNRDDGSVLVIAQGEKTNIDELVTFVRGNPGISKVENVNIVSEKNTEKYSDFKIVREESLFMDQKKALGNLGKRVLGRTKL